MIEIHAGLKSYVIRYRDLVLCFVPFIAFMNSYCLFSKILSAKFSLLFAGHHSLSRLQSWNIQSLEALSLMMNPQRKLWLIDFLCGRRRRVMHWRPSDRAHHWEELGLHLQNNQVHTCRWHCNILRNSIFDIPHTLHTKRSSVLIFGQFCWLRWLI